MSSYMTEGMIRSILLVVVLALTFSCMPQAATDVLEALPQGQVGNSPPAATHSDSKTTRRSPILRPMRLSSAVVMQPSDMMDDTLCLSPLPHSLSPLVLTPISTLPHSLPREIPIPELPDIVIPDRHQSLQLGFRVGGGYSTIGNLSSVFDDGTLSPSHLMNASGAFTPMGGFFLGYRRGALGVELAADYAQMRSTISRQDVRTGENDKIDFSYHYVCFGLYPKLYFDRRFYLGLGCRIGLNLSPHNINVRISEAHFEQEGQMRRRLRETISGGLDIAPGVKIGYDFPVGLHIEASYHYGMNSILKVQHPNPYGYASQHNSTQYIGLTVGWRINLFESSSEHD